MKHIILIFCIFSFGIQQTVTMAQIITQAGKLNGIEVELIESGSFRIGDRKGELDEQPVRKIEINSFLIGKHEVSNSEFAEFLNEKGNQFEANTLWINLLGEWNSLKCRIYESDNRFFVEKGFEEYPVNFVSWYGAKAFCDWKGGRLPTESEWEYVVKGGKKYNKKILQNEWTNLTDFAWYKDNSKEQIHQKAQKKALISGVYDLIGNLWEWCSDYYQADYYKNMARKNPLGPPSGDFKVIRGGSWTNEKQMLRISNRNAINPNSNKINVGFRIVFDIK